MYVLHLGFANPEPENPKVSLHGGPIGYDYVPWTLLTPSDPPTLFTPAELTHLSLAPASESESYAVFRLVSPSGDQGYPGKLIVEALIALLGPGEQQRKYRVPGVKQEEEEYDLGSIVLVYRARVEPENGKKVVTPINLTQVNIFVDSFSNKSSNAMRPL